MIELTGSDAAEEKHDRFNCAERVKGVSAFKSAMPTVYAPSAMARENNSNLNGGS